MRILALIGIIALVSCGTARTGLFETFFVGDEGTQYFIKPFPVQGHKHKGVLENDFTFRYKGSNDADVQYNFTVVDKRVFKEIDSVVLSGSGHRVLIRNPRLLFNEKSKKDFRSRFQSRLSLSDLERLFNSDNGFTAEVFTPRTTVSFTPSGKTIKKVKVVNNDLFVLFRQQ